MKNIINIITLSRILCAPFIYICITAFESFGVAFLLFIFASITDFLDGYLARKFNATSELGRILDPIADKILIAFTLIALTLYLDSFYLGVMTATILAREFWVSALRELNAINKNLDATKVTFMAKIKTTAQFIAISGFVLALYFNLAILLFVSNFILLVAVLVTLITGIEYTTNTLKVTLRED
jgi:CDP-diacylglycerol--glycerol-3-phosphate 3-phosphatidyltransferase